MSWDAYRTENPMLTEMREYNSRVRDRVLLKKGRTQTTPRPADEKKVEIEFTDRYSAMGIDRPDPKTMCQGACEGTGVVPIYGEGWKPKDAKTGLSIVGGPSSVQPAYQERWAEAEAKEATDDGWHFVKCMDCNGTGKRATEEALSTTWVEDLQNLIG
jgi:hypothetical protein